MAYDHIVRKESGFGIVFAVLQWVIFIFGWPRLSAYVWPQYMKTQAEYGVPDTLYLYLCALCILFFMLTTGNLFYMIIYLGKFEFFEQYRASNDPWPWESDPKEWHRLKWRSIRYSLFNLLVTTPCLLVPFLWSEFEIPNVHRSPNSGRSKHIRHSSLFLSFLSYSRIIASYLSFSY